jgi:hypothetical protein
LKHLLGRVRQRWLILDLGSPGGSSRSDNDWRCCHAAASTVHCHELREVGPINANVANSYATCIRIESVSILISMISAVPQCVIAWHE